MMNDGMQIRGVQWKKDNQLFGDSIIWHWVKELERGFKSLKQCNCGEKTEDQILIDIVLYYSN